MAIEVQGLGKRVRVRERGCGPGASLTTFPAQALLGRLGPRLLVLSPAMAPLAVLLAVLLARRAWPRSLGGYTGASS
jgi:ABC-2 type transport system permease protein